VGKDLIDLDKNLKKEKKIKKGGKKKEKKGKRSLKGKKYRCMLNLAQSYDD
jgi:hypothetical protein